MIFILTVKFPVFTDEDDLDLPEDQDDDITDMEMSAASTWQD